MHSPCGLTVSSRPVSAGAAQTATTRPAPGGAVAHGAGAGAAQASFVPAEQGGADGGLVPPLGLLKVLAEFLEPSRLALDVDAKRLLPVLPGSGLGALGV